MRGQIEACGNILWKIVTMLTCKLCSFEPRMVARDSSNYLVAGFLRNVPQDRWSSATFKSTVALEVERLTAVRGGITPFDCNHTPNLRNVSGSELSFYGG